jgi:UDP-N-acetylmuramoyl-tripeptide--D-alanyl-D-alanine ligase
MMSIAEAARALDAGIRGPDVVFEAVGTDSRSIGRGELFIALRGERFDGHRFIAQAAAAGAAAAMVEDGWDAAAGLPLLVVKNTRLALGRLAAYWRRKFTLPLVALTGSSGKTTVKEMLAGILGESSKAGPRSANTGACVLATRGNLNNDIGVPLMLLELRAAHRYAVIEMGMNHAGEIAYLSQLAAPDVALINNAGHAHIEFLGTQEAIARAKGEIFEGLKDDGTAVINADEQHAPLWRVLAGDRKRLEFGIDHPADVTATYQLRQLESEIVVKTPLGSGSVILHAPGLHNVRNALAASAAAAALDVAPETIAAGLSRFTGVSGRLQRAPCINGATLIDDTYNANPESVRAAIAVLAQEPGVKLLALGDMGELGEDAPELHSQVGRWARDAGIDRLFALGELSRHAAQAFGRGASHFQRIEEMLPEIGMALIPGATLLVKGSRFMRMERVVSAFALAPGAAGRTAEEEIR